MKLLSLYEERAKERELRQWRGRLKQKFAELQNDDPSKRKYRKDKQDVPASLPENFCNFKRAVSKFRR